MSFPTTSSNRGAGLVLAVLLFVAGWLVTGGTLVHAAGLGFVENVGQYDPEVRFMARSAGLTLWAADNHLWLTWVIPRDPGAGRKHGFPQREQSI